MVWRIGARLHAFAHGLLRPSEGELARRAWQELAVTFEAVGLGDDAARNTLIGLIAEDARQSLGVGKSADQSTVILRLAADLVDYDQMFVLPQIEGSRELTVAEAWNLRAEIDRQRALLADFEATCQLIAQATVAVLHPLYSACPALLEAGDDPDGIRVSTSLLHSLRDIGAVTQAVFSVPFAEELEACGLLCGLRARLNRNLVLASGGNPDDPRGLTRAPKTPEQFDAKSPEHLVQTYLGGTPLLPLFDQTLDFVIPTATRFEHHHIVAGSGHGKTQTLQYLIANDLPAVARGERSVVVLDSQGDLIRTISGLAAFAPGEPLHERIVIIDPSDVEWPVSLNLFDVGQSRLEGYAPLERERLTNSILELYDFVLGSLLSAEMTQKQNVIFRYVTRLMLHIPDATIHTLRELMESGSEQRFAADIAKLTGTARKFFQTEFSGREFEQTKKQVLRRLWGILENQTFERMFSHPRSKLDLFSEMNAGKVILINTAKDLLKEQGSEIFGRFFIALIAQAAQERATLRDRDRLPTLVYIDEAQDYFDRNIGLILAQARKYKVGVVLAHQYLGQLEPKLQEAFAANTAIKFAGGVSAKDARSLAPMLHCSPDLIEAQPKGGFAVDVRGRTKSAVPLTFPFGFVEDMPRMSAAERTALRARMRERYAVHHTELRGPDAVGATDEAAAVEETGAATPPPPPPNPKPTVRLKPPPTERRPKGHVDTDPGESW